MLTGRGGGGFPTGLKWELVKNAKGDRKYIVCNGSEGEPGVFKDHHILSSHPETLIQGISLALQTIPNSSAYIFLNKKYYSEFKSRLTRLIRDLPITLFKKKGGYLSGEETVLLNEIQNCKRYEPRLKPPYPTEKGLFSLPTLVNNVETFYHIAKIAEGKYKKTRFYSISYYDPNNKKFPDKAYSNSQIHELPVNWTVKQILTKTNNWPKYDFFVQTGGGAIGEILLPRELSKKKACGAGAIIIYNKEKTDILKFMKNLAQFFLKGNCDKCVPCREGVYRIDEMLKTKRIDPQILEEIFFVMDRTSFCPLGKGVPITFKSLLSKIYKFSNEKK